MQLIELLNGQITLRLIMLKFIRKIIRTDLLIGAMKKFFATVMYCCVVSFPLMVSAQEQKPNVIYILADDLGYGDVGYNGQELIETPELDKLAHNGIRVLGVLEDRC